MKLFHKTVASIAVATTTALSLSATAYAATLSKQLAFQTSNQSIWDTGDAKSYTFEGEKGFLGVSWDKESRRGSRRINYEASTKGKLGLQNTLKLDGGTVNAFIPVNLLLTTPDKPVATGETFTLKSDFYFDKKANFSTSSPNASYSLDLVFRLAAALDVNPLNFLDFEFDTKEQTKNLVRFNTKDLSFKKEGSLGKVDVNFPNVDTVATNEICIFSKSCFPRNKSALFSSEKDIFLKGTADLDLIATSLLGLPPLEGGGSRLGFGFNYNLVDVEAIAALSLMQNFSLTGTLPGLLRLENGTEIPFKVGDDITITMPSGVGSSLDLDAFIDFDALFSNKTSLGLDFALDLLVGKFKLINPIRDLTVGPIYDPKPINLFYTDFEVYKKQFKLAGFNQEKVNFQVEVETVPEPSSTLGMLAFGALGVGWLLKRKQQQKALDNSLT